jgi:two-component system OmpR family response regulator
MKILVVDDDPRLREVVTIALERAEFSVVTAADGQRALTHAAREAPDLIVLDIGLPEIDGLEVCRRLRARSDVPVIFLTARDDEIDRVVGLELGADDYVTKPFSPRELVARVRAVLKRTRGAAAAAAALNHGVLTLDPAAHHCRVAGVEVALTATEMRILSQLMRRPGIAIGRAQLITQIWGAGTELSDRTLDSHLRNLRAKLSVAGCDTAIETVHGVGIRLGTCAA